MHKITLLTTILFLNSPLYALDLKMQRYCNKAHSAIEIAQSRLAQLNNTIQRNPTNVKRLKLEFKNQQLRLNQFIKRYSVDCDRHQPLRHVHFI